MAVPSSCPAKAIQESGNGGKQQGLTAEQGCEEDGDALGV